MLHGRNRYRQRAMEVHILSEKYGWKYPTVRGSESAEYKKTGLEQDIFIFHTVFPMLGDGVKLARTDKDDVAGFTTLGLVSTEMMPRLFFITMISTSLCQ